jgi:hypothetical protein
MFRIRPSERTAAGTNTKVDFQESAPRYDLISAPTHAAMHAKSGSCILIKQEKTNQWLESSH